MQLTHAQAVQEIRNTDFTVTMENSCTYWNHKGLFQDLYAQLNAMIPASGACENARTTNKKLDKMRRAANCMYDLYNNGLYNRVNEFRNLFGIASSNYRVNRTHARFLPSLYADSEHIMNLFIIDAALEQGLIEA